MNRLLVLWLLTFIEISLAHPTSFKGSTGLMSQTTSKRDHYQVNYSHEYYLATGAHLYQDREGDDMRRAGFLSSNFLLFRENSQRFQANLYGIIGAGSSELSGEKETAGLYRIQADIEDRKYYFLINQTGISTKKQRELDQRTIRLGTAPYVGNFEDLHMWLIAEWQESRRFASKPRTEFTPILRLFYQNVLLEIGRSVSGDMKFNTIIHF
ncbi:MAG: hypothetical protein HRU19_16860 [Pseudobacteriovorax sp.]|nr:hypothetical protein [Pseudobacteriovorax sp.]